MALPDIFDFLDLRPYLCAVAAHHPLGSVTRVSQWMGRALGCSRQQAYNLIMGVSKVQPDDVPTLGRLLDLEGPSLEYLRLLVALQHATEANAAERRLSVWAAHAVARGHAPFPVHRGGGDDDVEGLWEATALALTPMLEQHAPWAETPGERAGLIFNGPDANAMRWAMERRAEISLGGEARGPRLWILEPPDLRGGLVDASWHGMLDMAREALIRVAAPQREYFLFTSSADALAEERSWAAVDRLRVALRALVRRSAEKPVSRLYLALTEQLLLTEVPPKTGPKRPLVQEPPRSLTRARGRGKSEEERVTSSDHASEGRPCLLHYLEFSPFALAWLRWKQGERRGVSYRTLAKRCGISKSLLQELFKGATPVLPQHLPGLAKGMELPEREVHYLEGVSRLAVATDPEDQATEHRALIAWAEQHGIYTPAGESFKLISHWGAHAILALTALHHFRPSAGWISMALRGRLSMDSAEHLLRALLRTGELVRGPEGGYTPAVSERLLFDVSKNAASYAHHHSQLNLARAELLAPGPGQRHQGLALALAEDDLPRALQAVQACKEEVASSLRDATARAEAGQARLDRVVNIGLQFFPLTSLLIRAPKGRGR